ncbi:hypothetical protein C1645_833539 [Glomus cerebriforme]|uniref:Uncharacterized protein n=1 Tax=Glomus cerebriforme TaxID=658196 RepID=A0A397SBC0_9GLOM|nr:hypothetical protein C1645_833539 [Glomus cerebriforme]
MLKIDEPVAPATIPSCMTAWHYCINNVTPAGALNPIMGAQINVNPPLIPGQLVINIQLTCLYHGVPANFVIPSPPLPNHIPIDLYYVQYAVLNCIV